VCSSVPCCPGTAHQHVSTFSSASCCPGTAQQHVSICTVPVCSQPQTPRTQRLLVRTSHQNRTAARDKRCKAGYAYQLASRDFQQQQLHSHPTTAVCRHFLHLECPAACMMDVVLNGSCTQLLQGSQSRRQRRLEHQHKQYSMQTSRQQGSQTIANSKRAGQSA
jgi:hypothetical protein